MPDFIIWSAPEEPYIEHITLCIDSWNKIKGKMLPTLCRLFEMQVDAVKKGMEFTILCHDIGKLSRQWQDYIHKSNSERKFGPPHATLGASYLLISSDNNHVDLNNATSLAILMHHTDSGLAYGNLEHPAEDAINRNLVDYGTGNIRWTEGAEEVFKQSIKAISNYDGLKPLSSVTIRTLEEMALQLRLWARCPKEIERHKHRLQALAIHHLLKVCDWRAAAQRPQLDSDEEGEITDKPNKRDWQESILSVYLDGGLLP